MRPRFAHSYSPIQDSYQQPIARMLDFFTAAYQENPGATLEVFVHKAESLAEDYKIGTWSCDSQFTSSSRMDLTPALPLMCSRDLNGTRGAPRCPAVRDSCLTSENFRHIQQRVIDELFDASPEYEQMPVNFHLTSVYDHSIREAFSRVLHKLIDSLPYLEDLLNVFCSVSDAHTVLTRPES